MHANVVGKCNYNIDYIVFLVNQMSLSGIGIYCLITLIDCMRKKELANVYIHSIQDNYIYNSC